VQERQISAAALDTSIEELLADDSPYWELGNIYVRPHMSGATYARSAAKAIAYNILRIEKGESPYPIHVPQ